LYDVAIIGAGINGCSLAYELIRANKKVLLLDMQGVASGGSGAAGAFISPKFSKAGELKELLHEAFVYSFDFYKNNFPHIFKITPLVHIAQDESDDATLRAYKQNTSLCLQEAPKECLDSLTSQARLRENVSLEAGVVDARRMCIALSKEAEFRTHKVESLVYDDGMWVIDELYSASDVVLATGAYESLIKEPYIKLRGIWGHRIDIQTSTRNSCSLHQDVSISPSENGVLAIGATHNVHYHPQTSEEPYDVEEGRAELLQKAAKTIDLKDVKVLKDYTGLRSGSFDYIPIIGPLVDSAQTLACCEKKVKVKKPNYDDFVSYPNLYMINGNGGYGFVLAPYLSKILAKHIVADATIPRELACARFFARWAKREA
jgi:tRNA 5-methylaminomethyl-2-thiouridine biosynthesis bifunctional protein